MKDLDHYGRLKDVNTSDIPAAIELGCQSMGRLFNREDNDLPYMVGITRPEAGLSDSVTWSGHLHGRHLNALLNAEDALGIKLDEGAIDKHRRAALFAYSGAVPLPLGRRHQDGPLATFSGHNVREGFHALYALAAFRDDDEARRIAEASVGALFDLWHPDRGWDTARMERDYGLTVGDIKENFTRTLPRAIGSLVKYYTVTGYGGAIELAIALKDKLLMDHFHPDGVYTIERLGTHGHSIACDLSSLAQLAELTSDAALIERVRAFYDGGMWELRDEIGWVVEKTGESCVLRPDVGEVNTTGDLVETALILGRWGLPEYFEDAERILRCHLLPSQLRDTGFIIESPNPENVDGLRDVAARLRGGFGFPAPYGHEPLELTGPDFESVRFHSDIVGGAVGSLCEAYRWATRFDTAGHHVDLLFDHETDTIKVESIYTNDAFSVTLKKDGPLWIRLPSWLEPEKITVEGNRGDPRFSDTHLFLAAQPVDVPLIFRYELPVSEIVLHHRTRDIRVRLRGDSVEAMANFGADLTFFDSLDG